MSAADEDYDEYDSSPDYVSSYDSSENYESEFDVTSPSYSPTSPSYGPISGDDEGEEEEPSDDGDDDGEPRVNHLHAKMYKNVWGVVGEFMNIRDLTICSIASKDTKRECTHILGKPLSCLSGLVSKDTKASDRAQMQKRSLWTIQKLRESKVYKKGNKYTIAHCSVCLHRIRPHESTMFGDYHNINDISTVSSALSVCFTCMPQVAADTLSEFGKVFGITTRKGVKQLHQGLFCLAYPTSKTSYYPSIADVTPNVVERLIRQPSTSTWVSEGGDQKYDFKPVVASELTISLFNRVELKQYVQGIYRDCSIIHDTIVPGSVVAEKMDGVTIADTEVAMAECVSTVHRDYPGLIIPRSHAPLWVNDARDPRRVPRRRKRTWIVFKVPRVPSGVVSRKRKR
jgi:hypothetical protein